MPQPLFNGHPIFDSLDSNGNNVSEGVLCVPSFTPIMQSIHFQGNIGNFTLYHGFPDLPWSFVGLIAAPTLSQFNTLIKAIQQAIFDCTAGNNTTYHTLVDSYGNWYDNAQVRSLDYIEPPHSFLNYITSEFGLTTMTSGYVCKVKSTGIIQAGTTQVGGTT